MKNSFLKPVMLAFSLWAGAACSAQGLANLQFIHNSPDPALDTIDVYINGAVDSNVLFRTAFGFYQVQSDTGTTVIIAHKHSDGNFADSIRSFYFNSFANNGSYALILYGLADTGFEPNLDTLNTGLSMEMISEIDSTVDTAEVAFKFFQGATDLPAMKIIQRVGGQTVVPDILYGDTTQYDSLHHSLYELQLISADSSQNFGTYIADLTDFGGQVGIIFTSGFLDLLQNDTGRALRLYMVFSDGVVVPFILETSFFQLLHNCADTAADTLDVYINGKIAYPDFAFRNATPALPLFAYATYNIGLAHKNSTSVNDAFWNNQFIMKPDSFYIATMSGLINPAGYASNPDGENTALNVWVKSPAEYTGSSFVNFDFFFIHGATDAPALQLLPEGGPPVINDAVYGSMSNYFSFPPLYYTFNLQDTSGNLIGSYFANFPAFSGQSGVLLASGFLNSLANNNGPGIGLYLAPITGGPFIPLYPVTGINNITENNSIKIFPNPASNQIFIRINEAESQNANIQIMTVNGQTVKSIFSDGSLTKGQTLSADVSDLSNGFYILRFMNANTTIICKFVIAGNAF